MQPVDKGFSIRLHKLTITAGQAANPYAVASAQGYRLFESLLLFSWLVFSKWLTGQSAAPRPLQPLSYYCGLSRDGCALPIGPMPISGQPQILYALAYPEEWLACPVVVWFCYRCSAFNSLCGAKVLPRPSLRKTRNPSRWA